MQIIPMRELKNTIVVLRIACGKCDQEENI